MKSYIVHLQRAIARKDRVAYLKSNLPGDVYTLDAIDGQTLTETARASYEPKLYRPHYPFGLRDSEIACFHSHRKAWQTIVETGDEFALLAEDDIVLDSTVFECAFDLAKQHISPDRYIRFPIVQREFAASPIARAGEVDIVKPDIIGLGMHLQLIGRNYAEALLKKTEKFDRPVDTFLQMHWVTNQTPLSVYPSGVSEQDASIGGSMIGKKMRIREKIHHEIMRPIYRRSISKIRT